MKPDKKGWLTSRPRSFLCPLLILGEGTELLPFFHPRSTPHVSSLPTKIYKLKGRFVNRPLMVERRYRTGQAGRWLLATLLSAGPRRIVEMKTATP